MSYSITNCVALWQKTQAPHKLTWNAEEDVIDKMTMFSAAFFPQQKRRPTSCNSESWASFSVTCICLQRYKIRQNIRCTKKIITVFERFIQFKT